MELNGLLNEDTMPVSDKQLKKYAKKMQTQYRNELRSSLSEICSFDEVMEHANRLEEKMKASIEEKAQ